MTTALFDASTFKDKAPRSIIPNGTYRLIVDNCEKKPTKDGSGAYLAFSFSILDGEHAGRKLWHNFNLWNKSAQAVEIAQSEIKELCEAVGILAPTLEADFIGKTVAASVKVAKRKDTGEDENRVSGYMEDAGPGMAPVARRVVQAGGIGATPKWAQPKPAA